MCAVWFPPQIVFGFPVPDALVGAFGHIVEGDVFYTRGLFADALKRYAKCVDTAGAFEGRLRFLGGLRCKMSTTLLRLGCDLP